MEETTWTIRKEGHLNSEHRHVGGKEMSPKPGRSSAHQKDRIQGKGDTLFDQGREGNSQSEREENTQKSERGGGGMPRGRERNRNK